MTEAKCECGAGLDSLEHHSAACPRSGRLRTRALGPKRTLAKELPCDATPRTWTSQCPAQDERAIKVFALALPQGTAMQQRRTSQFVQKPLVVVAKETGRKVEQRSHPVHRRSGGGLIKGGTTSDAKVSFPGLEEEVVPHDRQSVCQAVANAPHTLAARCLTCLGLSPPPPPLPPSPSSLPHPKKTKQKKKQKEKKHKKKKKKKRKGKQKVEKKRKKGCHQWASSRLQVKRYPQGRGLLPEVGREEGCHQAGLLSSRPGVGREGRPKVGFFSPLSSSSPKKKRKHKKQQKSKKKNRKRKRKRKKSATKKVSTEEKMGTPKVGFFSPPLPSQKETKQKGKERKNEEKAETKEKHKRKNKKKRK